MYIHYDHYRIFYYVAKYGSFTRAAELLLNNQPNITRTVKNLEQALGCTLFVRSSRSVQLTPEGEALYAHIAVAMEHIAMGEAEITQGKELQRGVVSIGASEVALRCFLLPVLKAFRRAYPGVHIRIANHTTPQAVSALSRGLVDLAVVTTPLELPDAICSTEVKRFRELPLCGEGLAHLASTPLSLRELAQYPLICLAPKTTTYAFYLQLFAKHGLSLSPHIEAATADQLLPLIVHDLGIGFVPEQLAAGAIAERRAFPLQLQEEIPERSICLLKNTAKPASAAARVLETSILESRA